MATIDAPPPETNVGVPPAAPEPKPLASGKIPFRSITWGDVKDGIAAALKPDVASNVVVGNIVYLLVLATLTVCKNWSLLVAGHCGDVFQNVSLHESTDRRATPTVVSTRPC